MKSSEKVLQATNSRRIPEARAAIDQQKKGA